MRVAGAQSFLEVGVGTGLYSSLILRKIPDIQGVGFDISPSVKLFTEMHYKALGISERYNCKLFDVTQEIIEPKAHWLICVEVLEHLDDPVAFLKALKRNMQKNAKAFIGAAINAANDDHIYLYRNSKRKLNA